uniref:Water stress and hypersensitive response domain-containing protein n=1 Tax=Chenopodium quinoa TaxID=63459 RepID=A0A803MW36_CHEQI
MLLASNSSNLGDDKKGHVIENLRGDEHNLPHMVGTWAPYVMDHNNSFSLTISGGHGVGSASHGGEGGVGGDEGHGRGGKLPFYGAAGAAAVAARNRGHHQQKGSNCAPAQLGLTLPSSLLAQKWNWPSAIIGATTAAATAALITARPRDPAFEVISIDLTAFKFNFPALDAELILTVHVNNPNIAAIHYDSTTMSIFYDGALLGSAQMEAGSQPARSCRLLRFPARLSGLELMANHARRFLADVAKREMVIDAAVDVDGVARVLCKRSLFVTKPVKEAKASETRETFQEKVTDVAETLVSGKEGLIITQHVASLLLTSGDKANAGNNELETVNRDKGQASQNTTLPVGEFNIRKAESVVTSKVWKCRVKINAREKGETKKRSLEANEMDLEDGEGVG